MASTDDACAKAACSAVASIKPSIPNPQERPLIPPSYTSILAYIRESAMQYQAKDQASYQLLLAIFSQVEEGKLSKEQMEEQVEQLLRLIKG